MFKQHFIIFLLGLFIIVSSASEYKNENIANSTDLNNEPAEINATIVSPVGSDQSYDVWTCRVTYNYQIETYYFWTLIDDSQGSTPETYGVAVQNLDNRFWSNDAEVKKPLFKPMIKNFQYPELDPWLVKHEKWAKSYNFTSYKDMCDYWIKNKNAPLLGGVMQEIVKNTIWSSTGPKEHVHVNSYDCGNDFWRGLRTLNCKTWERQFTATLTKTTLNYDSNTKEIEKIEQPIGTNVFNCPWMNLKDKNGRTRKFKNFCQTYNTVVRFIEEEKDKKVELPDKMGCSKVDRLQSENTLVKVFNQGNSPYLLVPSLGLYLKNFRKCSERVRSCHSNFFAYICNSFDGEWHCENRTALCTAEGYIIATKEPSKEFYSIYKLFEL